MRKFMKLSLVALIGFGIAAPAFAKGGGGWPSSPAMTKTYHDQYIAACKADARHCVGFGKHYFGQ